jgi:adenosylcobyric acid synthase
MPALMIQGCGSDVGKSVLVAGLCRLFTNRGIVVRPFKSQNMSNNAAVTPDGGEIGRAQALQARACRTLPTVDMNPVLLKPQSDVGAQLIVRGRMAGTLDASAHGRDKRALLDVAVQSYRRLEREAQQQAHVSGNRHLIIVEGAGSPAETNLRKNDIANMGLAQALGLPVILVGDINRGHVIASLVGAHVVLDPDDRALIHGFIVNKFRGNVALFDEGLRRITEQTGWRSIGVVPWLHAASRLPSEDGVQLEDLRVTGHTAAAVPPAHPAAESAQPAHPLRVKVAVPLLSRIANFDDFDPLRDEPGVELVFIPPGRPIPLDASLIVIPGTKSTISDMEFMRAQGWDIDILAHVRHGGRVLGICGGYQMLGHTISDPDGIEGLPNSLPGLGLLDVSTVMTGDKALREVSGVLVNLGSPDGAGAAAYVDVRSGAASAGRGAPAGDAPFAGYEMHIGSTTGPSTRRPLLRFSNGTSDGAMSPDGSIAGCYVHGLFGATTARAALLSSIGAVASREDHGSRVDAALDEIARVLESSLDVAALAAIAGL